MNNFLSHLDENQKKAIDYEKNIGVSAGAGSGKTRVLTGRIQGLLSKKINLEEIVSITFTDKAALQMKEKVREALIMEMGKSNEENKSIIQEHLDKMNSCNISTIHSFCLKIIKENAAYLGLDYNVENISKINKELILERLFKEEIGKFSQDELNSILVIVTQGNPLDESIIEALIKIRSKIYNSYHSFEEAYENSNKDCINEAVFKVLNLVEVRYKDYKKENNLLDYDDILTIANELLEDDEIRESYKERYKYFLVDEFQDTNEIQRKILYNLVCDKEGKILAGKLFIVGDIKQGIYSFRGTDCNIFNEVLEEIQNTEDNKGEKIVLNTCYRSCENLVDGINSIFSEIIENYESMDVNKREAEENKEVKRIIYIENDKVEQDSKVNDIVKDFVSKEKTLVEAKETLKKIEENKNKLEEEDYCIVEAINTLKEKNIGYEDTCILVRKSKVIPQIEKELKSANIPYCIISGKNFYDKEEIKLLINLYEISHKGIDNMIEKEDTELLLSTLRSLIFNISDKLLFKCYNTALEYPLQTSFIDLIYLYIDGHKNEQEVNPLVEAIDKLKIISELSKKYTTTTLIEKIIEVLEIKKVVISLNDGLQKYRNVEKFIEETSKIEKNKLLSNAEFLEELYLLEEYDDETSEALLDTEKSKAVKVMTIHMSKGLEFKGVIFTETNSKFTRTNRNIIDYSNNNVIVKAENSYRKKSDLLHWSKYESENKKATIEEELRVLYVAMTRAEEYFIFTGKGIECPKKEALTVDTVLGKVISEKEEVKKYLEEIKASSIRVTLTTNNESLKEKVVDYSEVLKRIEYKREVANAKTISVSTYMKYKLCPRKYYYENIIKIDREFLNREENKGNSLEEENKKNTGTEIGTIVHGILESFDKDIIELDTIIEEDAVKYIENFNSIEEENIKTKESMKLKYRESEMPFTCKIEDSEITLIGFIDRVDVYEKDNKLYAEVIDYKTNSAFNKSKIRNIKDYYQAQLLLYAKIIKDVLSIENRKIDVVIPRIYLLSNGEVLDYQYEEERVNKLFEEIKEIFKEDLEKKEYNCFEKTTTKACEYCGYNTLCSKH